jgi:hypothetical protein
MRRSRSMRIWASGVAGVLALLVAGCFPPEVPEEQPLQEAPPVEEPSEAVRPVVISPVNMTAPPYAHRIVPVRDRNYRLRSQSTIGDYNTEVRRQIMRLSLAELENEIAVTGWSPYITTGPVPEHLIPDPPRGDYDADAHRAWLESRGRSWYGTDYDWPNRLGGATPSTDQSSLRDAWIPWIGDGAGGGGAGAGGAAGGLPGGMMGGPMGGPMAGGMGSMMGGPMGGPVMGGSAGGPSPGMPMMPGGAN